MSSRLIKGGKAEKKKKKKKWVLGRWSLLMSFKMRSHQERWKWNVPWVESPGKLRGNALR
jgi:hypothetical protein